MKTKNLLFVIIAALVLSLIAESSKAQNVGYTTSRKVTELTNLANDMVAWRQDSTKHDESGRIYDFFKNSDDWSNLNYLSRRNYGNHSSVSFRKELLEPKSIDREYEVDFGEKQSSMEMSIEAFAKRGKILITIINPMGKTFKVITVEDFEKYGWDQTINAFSDEKKKEYYGKWKIVVKATNATGSYKVELSVR